MGGGGGTRRKGEVSSRESPVEGGELIQEVSKQGDHFSKKSADRPGKHRAGERNGDGCESKS